MQNTLTFVPDGSIMHNMHTERRQLRITAQAHRDLRFITAYTGENLIQVVERLAKEEREHLEQQQREEKVPKTK